MWHQIVQVYECVHVVEERVCVHIYACAPMSVCVSSLQCGHMCVRGPGACACTCQCACCVHLRVFVQTSCGLRLVVHSHERMTGCIPVCVCGLVCARGHDRDGRMCVCTIAGYERELTCM